MPCTPFNLPGGGRGFICTRSRAPRPRCACGRPAAIQCDGPSTKPGKTCDRHLCSGCATNVGPNEDLCPEHAAQRAPVQASLEF